MRVNGVELAVQTFGDPADPAILLIAGGGSAMDGWPVEFCERLAAGPRFAIRYDQRDTGDSTTCSPGAPDYRTSDLVNDVFGILDQFGIDRGHLVGISMGGAIAQLAALSRPDRVASLTLIATTSIEDGGPALPGVTAELREFLSGPGVTDWSDTAAVVDYLVAFERILAGDVFDELAVRAQVEASVARSRNVESALTNYLRLPDEESAQPSLSTLDVPTLVVHGSRDPLFPLPHGQALAAAIPGARLLVVEGMGHEPPPPSRPDAMTAILRLTSRG